MAQDQHVPQNQLTDEIRADVLSRIRALAGEEWTTLLARALIVREGWDHASAELEEADATPGPNDGPWNAWHILNHVAGVNRRAAGHLAAMSAGEARQITPGEHWLGDDATFLTVRSGAIANWDAFVGAITEATIAQPEEGATATHPAWGELNARELVASTLLHMEDHARQMREIRGLASDENPGDSAGDLGRRRQTAH